ncbi:DNRLRE domain-containing protein [Actinopolymorpha sp. B9G3]|uniref:golvesin C-terminal-like domain-containing protein n=1 Tax=Actinopolymorpha sp. B9G3 TaxID=3158970 RepID=UPI0032D8D610
MPKPFMYDSTDDADSPYGKVWSDKVTQTASQQGSQVTVTVRADGDWLADSARKFPVVVDPTIKLAPNWSNGQDTMIQSGSPSTNFGDSSRMAVGTSNSQVTRALVQFDLSQLPDNTTLDTAHLELYYDQVHTTNDYAVDIEPHRVTAPWTEMTATWNSMSSNFNGSVPRTKVQVDNSDTGQVSMVGSWPASTSSEYTQYGINQNYQYNNDAATGDKFTWVPDLPESGDYEVRAHHVPSETNRATNAPYTVYFDGGQQTYPVDQSAGTGGVWTALGTKPFLAGSSHKVVLGDVSNDAVIADAVEFSKWATVTKGVNQTNRWHSFSVTTVVQSWLDGTNPNYGFMVRAADESVMGRGGPRYLPSEPIYNEETAVRPRLILTYGRPGVALSPVKKTYATGGVLSWSAYQDPSAASGDDIVEYQVHRSKGQHFVPQAKTLVAPVDKASTTYTDTTATPTPADSTDPMGTYYYYMVAVKTADGEVIPAPTQLAWLPKAGQIMQIMQASFTDTTVSSTQPDTNLNVLDGQRWLSVGNNSSTYGKTRALLERPMEGTIPSGVTVVDAELQLWQSHSTGSGATFDAHALTAPWSEGQATWNQAATSDLWTTAGGDYNAGVADDDTIGSDPKRQIWDVGTIVQGWVDDPASNYGLLLKVHDEAASGPQQQATFISSESDVDAELRPQFVVRYLEKTTESTYYAPYTPSRMLPNSTQTVDVTVSNATTSDWSMADWVISYHWELPDGTDVTTEGTRSETALPKNLVPGDTVTIPAELQTPIQADDGNKRTNYVLKWELRNKTTGQWLSQIEQQILPLEQSVEVEDPTSNQLGLERFYSYTGTDTGAGSAAVTNLYAGNTVWSYDAFTNPSRGLATFVRMSYNSMDTSPSSMGYGWSLQTSTLMRLGTPLDFQPNPNPTEVSLTDGDGTSHTFTWDPEAGEWVHPAGVHLYLQQLADCAQNDEQDRAWSMTRPDRTEFYFDCEGYQSAVVDNNGNEMLFTYEERQSHNQPTKFLKYITDPSNLETLTLDYYEKGQQDYTYIDATGAEQPGTNLTDPQIIDQMESITDISGRTITFTYTVEGLMAKMVDGAGAAEPKIFRFGYDADEGNKNVKLESVKDPQNNTTTLAYYDLPTDDPAFHWWNKTITDRRNNATSISYADADGSQGKFIRTVVTDAMDHATDYLLDGFGLASEIKNAKLELTKLGWDADNNLNRLEEANGAVSTWIYNPNTGYPTEHKDPKANQNSHAGTRYDYDEVTVGNPYVVDLASKTSPEGRRWEFDYNVEGDLTSVTDPAGTATTTPADDYQTTYAYDTWGQLESSTDANGNTTSFADYHHSGYPTKITDPQGVTTPEADDFTTTYAYDVRGQVTKVTDAAEKDRLQEYDVFGRPGKHTEPKDQAAGQLIVTPAPVYDRNDNITTATAPNGAVTTATWDATDQLTELFAPKDTPTGPERKTSYSYDKVGNLTKTVEPKGNLTPTVPNDFTTTYGYDPVNQLVSMTNADGGVTTYGYDNVGNLVEVVDPRKNATPDTTDFTTKYAYNRNHQRTVTTDAAGETTSVTYDNDGLINRTIDQAGNQTDLTLDARGKVSQVRVPHKPDAGSGTINHTTAYEYDQVGNTTKIISPRGMATTGVANDFLTEFVYDKSNRVAERLSPFNPSDTRYNTADKTIYTYDEVGRLSKVSAPPSDGQPTVRNDTSYTYFDNGWTKTTTDPWDITTTYDYNPLGQQTNRTLTSAGGSSARAMAWTYFPDGKVKTRTDDGIPVGAQTVLVDNSDGQNTTSTGTWATSSTGSGHQGYNYRTRAAGAESDTYTWKLRIPEDGSYQVYVKYPAVTGAATNASYSITHASGTATRTANQTTGAGSWVPLGAPLTFDEQATNQKITLTQAPVGGGTVTADAVKLVRNNSGDTDNEKTVFAYAYDPNGNLDTLTDTSPGSAIDTYTISYTGLNQTNIVTEKTGTTTKHTTDFDYNSVGDLSKRIHDNKPVTFEYDPRDLLSKITDNTGATAKITNYTYTPRMQRLEETKPNGNTVDYTYYLDGRLHTQTETKPAGTTVTGHTLAWDFNGNKLQDIAQRQNADNHAATLTTTSDYTYDPLDRIANVVKTGTSAGTETYIHDANNNVTTQTIKNITTNYTYNRNRLETATTSGATASYNYDPYGRLDTITAANDTVLESYRYDGFDRIKRHTKNTGTSTTTSAYSYDPLDRTASKTANVGATGEKTTRYDYLGLTDQLVTEFVAGQVTKSFSYDAYGKRLTQTTHQTGGTTEDAHYSYSPHTDVDALTDSTGDTKATYGYTAYGNNDENLFTGIDKPDPQDPTKEPYNPYRYTAKRYDPNTQTYDLGFRDYNPGLNRFLTRDQYNGALADQNLTTNPYTSNRYNLAAGNPISRIDLDGHYAVEEDGTPLAPDGVTPIGKPTRRPASPEVMKWIEKNYDDGGGGGDGGGEGPPTIDWDQRPEPLCGPCAEAFDRAEERAADWLLAGDEPEPGSWEWQLMLLTPGGGVVKGVGAIGSAGRAGVAANAGFRGGRYGELTTGNGIEVHHMPANSVTGLSRAEGPAIQMDRPDHYQTASWGRSKAAQAYRAEQKALVDAGRFDDAIQMDIDDITSKFPGKYDQAILEMIEGLW